MSIDPRRRIFAAYGPDDLARTAEFLRPLPWIDGLIAAMIISPMEPVDWLEHIWREGQLGKLTVPEAEHLESLVEDQFEHACNLLFDETPTYVPFLGDAGDKADAVAEWASGFAFGIRLEPEPWRPLIDADGTRALLCYIFCLDRDDRLTPKQRAESPFRDMPQAERDEIRRNAVSVLPEVVCALNGASIELDRISLDISPFFLPQTYARAAPKIGRNDPCPCGSGKKYKKCCLDRLD